ncbi:MAG: quinolinate synthase NadA [Nitrospinae bacterium]|nr:quinolinate synthase NadA [Nitrospinota bacterium]
MSQREEYENSLKQEIRQLIKEKNAIMLAHNYQRDEIQEIADVTGDSLYLSQVSADCNAEIIIFCGVHFMAESACVLAPDKKVILPRLEAGCPMADMITAEKLKKWKAENPGIPIVAYVNTTAEVKAESDICCTSGNAISVVNSIEADEVMMVPDQNLAQHTAKHTNKKVRWWKGFCPTHHILKKRDLNKLKEEHPDAKIILHPECPPDVLEMADHICSTSGMYSYCKESTAKKFIMGTEIGILYRLRKENQDKEFFLPEVMICPNMKVTTLEDVHDAIKNLEPVITVPEEIRVKAWSALDKMLKVPRDN